MLKLLAGARPFRRTQILGELYAGMNLAFVNIPQVLGYTRIAGTSVVSGLYTVLLPLVAFAIFGSSRHLVVAADSATAAIFSSELSPLAAPAGAHYMALASLVALWTAALLLVARLFRLGFLADFLSRTVLVGFLAGVGVQVAIAMLRDMCGLEAHSSETLVQAWQLLQSVAHPQWPTMLLSASIVAIILLGRRFTPRVPFSMIAVVAVIAASAAFNFSGQGIAVIGPVPGGLPPLQWPHVTWSEVLTMLPVAASCFVIIIAQSAATSQSFAGRFGESDDENADIAGLSAANFAAGFTGTFVVNGSPTQTAMAVHMGARSQIAQLVLAALVLLVLLTLTGPLQFLPRCALAAIVFTIAIGMIDVACLRDIHRQSPGEYYLAIATAGTVVAIGVEQGILLAIALSLFMHVRHSYRPHTLMLVPDAIGRWVPIAATPGKETAPGMIVYRFGADLFYANRKRFADEVTALVAGAPTKLRWFIIDAGAITDIDYSAALSICTLVAELQQQDIGVLFGRVNAFLRADMDRHGITAAVGESHIFTTLHDALALANAAPAARLS